MCLRISLELPVTRNVTKINKKFCTLKKRAHTSFGHVGQTENASNRKLTDNRNLTVEEDMIMSIQYTRKAKEGHVSQRWFT